MADLYASTIAAEARAVEEGHRCYLQADGTYDVVSDSFRDSDDRALHYQVKPCILVWPYLSFYCDHRKVAGFGEAPAMAPPGEVPCKHVALVMRRLERERKARFVAGDRPWQTTEPEPELVPLTESEIDDLFANL